AEEKVTVVGEKGELKMSILGPTRKATQVEISLTDARSIGVKAPIKESGDLAEAGPCKIVGPKGEITCEHAVIAAKRHIHATQKDAEELGITNGEIVKVEVDSPAGRKLIFDDVVCRVNDKFALAMHIDTDESAAAFRRSKAPIVK
ncbi:MAG: propanediol utilization protein, partial [Lachnospiraceae bacterium]|nr:propanediol utilization protein [Lachnospiraceae bacterium]